MRYAVKKDLLTGGYQSHQMTKLCCKRLNVTMYSRPQTLWGDYCGDYILSKNEINGRNYFVKINGKNALWYMTTPLKGWGFGDLSRQSKLYDNVIIQSNCQNDSVESCPHIIHDQWNYFDEITEDWSSAGSINIIVESVESIEKNVDTEEETTSTTNDIETVPSTTGKIKFSLNDKLDIYFNF